MDKEKISGCVHDLKVFFQKKNVSVSEVREVLYRVIDYIDEHFDEDSRNILFVNGNGNGKTMEKIIKNNAIKSR